MEVSPGELANELGISESMLRRYCSIYERLYGPLPRDSRQGRAFTSETAAIFRDARVSINKGESVINAFRMISPPEPSQAIYSNPGLSEIAELLSKLTRQNEELREEIRGLNGQIDTLRSEVQGLKALPAPTERRRFLQRFNWFRPKKEF